eukprot:PhM_4_TR18724/c3_g1_i3/m.73260
MLLELSLVKRFAHGEDRPGCRDDSTSVLLLDLVEFVTRAGHLVPNGVTLGFEFEQLLGDVAAPCPLLFVLLRQLDEGTLQQDIAVMAAMALVMSFDIVIFC